MSCSASDARMNVTSSLSFSSDVIASTNCATSSLVLSARPGQRLNLSLTDFHSHDVTGASPACHNYLQLTDVTSGDAMTVCASSERHKALMTSVGHQVKVKFQLHDARSQRFLLHAQGSSGNHSVYNNVSFGRQCYIFVHFQRSAAVT